LLLNQPLLTVNCHAGTETADFLGSLRPSRIRSESMARFHVEVASFFKLFGVFAASVIAGPRDASSALSPDVSLAADATFSANVNVSDTMRRVRDLYGSIPDALLDAKSDAALRLKKIEDAHRCASSLFDWVDGSLVTAMKTGCFFLLDECSLAEDAVLERLNSVLEPSRSLTLAEKGTYETSDSVIVAAKGFRFFATMNPGGDFGKRELSPALRSRFTEVYIPPVSDAADLLQIIRDKCVALSLFPRHRVFASNETSSSLNSLVTCVPSETTSWRSLLVDYFAPLLVRFVLWFDTHASSGRLVRTTAQQQAVSASAMSDVEHQGDTQLKSSLVLPATVEPPRARVLLVTLRDLHQWLAFMAELMMQQEVVEVSASIGGVSMWQAFCHAACLVLLDGLGLGTGLAATSCVAIREAAVAFLVEQAPDSDRADLRRIFFSGPPPETLIAETGLQSGTVRKFGIHPFFIPLGSKNPEDCGGAAYTFQAPTTRTNLFRVLRALQVRTYSIVLVNVVSVSISSSPPPPPPSFAQPYCFFTRPSPNPVVLFSFSEYYGVQLPGPVLLEGSPGVGKSSLIEALARASGYDLVRINLSEQTDLADLFGQDLPTASGRSEGSFSESPFSWVDGALLKVSRLHNMGRILYFRRIGLHTSATLSICRRSRLGTGFFLMS
jgi:MoxR-like ATPase